MAEQFDKLIQDGRTSFVPRSNKTRAFWTKHNAKIAGSQSAQKEQVTIVPASEEEVKMLLQAAAPGVQKAVPVVNELEQLKAQMAEQQALINKLLLGQVAPDGESQEPVKEKGKPGPKPKTQTDGEN